MPSLDHTDLLHLLRYSPDTGAFHWASKPARRIAVGSRAGYQSVNGYRAIKVLGSKYLEHRLAYFYMEGAWPPAEIDHRNRDRADNRWSNLRLASHVQNHQNRSNKAGVHLPGVQPTKAGNWAARIKLRGDAYHLGVFSSEVAAHAAYVSAKADMHPYSLPARP